MLTLERPSAPPAPAPDRPSTERIGARAIRALYDEVALFPKPGLVSRVDTGSHADMNFGTFMRSLQALQDYFPAIARLGTQHAPLAELRALGRAAEQRMLAATSGVNTHRGAIFNLGLLCAAAGLRPASATPEQLCLTVAERWGDELLAAAEPAASTHGAQMQRRYGSGGARLEAARGFPSVREVGLPAWRDARSRGASLRLAAVQCFFALVSELEDTNLLWRGGPQGLDFARRGARDFLRCGGVFDEGWFSRATQLHAEFVARDLSPGGAADLLGVSLFLAER